jgi:pimeloyl-ACP methyl ester carboxylesterase
VIGLHGAPGCRLNAVPDAAVLSGLDYLTYDRPGYGRSPRHRDRTVADCAADVAAIVDAVGWGRFAVVGGSAGAPHALACAALLPERVVGLGLVVPGGSVHQMGERRYFDGMNAENTRDFRAALHTPETLGRLLEDAELRRRAESPSTTDDPDRMLDDEAMRAGIGGLLDDTLAIHAEWGFTLSSVTAPIDIWYGVNDTYAPPSHALGLKEVLPHATLHPQYGGHAWPARKMPEIFGTLLDSVRPHFGSGNARAPGTDRSHPSS